MINNRIMTKISKMFNKRKMKVTKFKIINFYKIIHNIQTFNSHNLLSYRLTIMIIIRIYKIIHFLLQKLKKIKIVILIL